MECNFKYMFVLENNKMKVVFKDGKKYNLAKDKFGNFVYFIPYKKISEGNKLNAAYEQFRNKDDIVFFIDKKNEYDNFKIAKYLDKKIGKEKHADFIQKYESVYQNTVKIMLATDAEDKPIKEILSKLRDKGLKKEIDDFTLACQKTVFSTMSQGELFTDGALASATFIFSQYVKSQGTDCDTFEEYYDRVQEILEDLDIKTLNSFFNHFDFKEHIDYYGAAIRENVSEFIAITKGFLYLIISNVQFAVNLQEASFKTYNAHEVLKDFYI